MDLFNYSLVSVIIPAYNHEKYIQETIQSIINQTYENIELIIIDDGSTDDTWQKINELKEKCEKRFRNTYFATKCNSGTCETLNLLLEKTQGEYIYLIASDDIAKPNAIALEVSFLKDNPNYALVVGDNEIIDANSVVCYWDEKQNCVYETEKATYKTFGDLLKKTRKDIEFSSEQFGTHSALMLMNHVPNGYLIRKSIFKKIGMFTNKAPLEDYWLMLQISKYAKMKYLDEVLFSYRWHSTNTIKQTEKMEEYTIKTRQYEEFILKNGVITRTQHIGKFIKIKVELFLHYKIITLNIFKITFSIKRCI